MDSQPADDIIMDEAAIASAVRQVADRLNRDFTDAVTISVVPGGIFFTADLTRQLTFPIEMDILSCPHTPGDRHNSSAIVYHQNIAIDNRHVILLDDAIESGGTLQRVIAHLTTHYRPASISVAVLFVKPGRVALPVKQYYGHEMDNDGLLVGYGLPWKNRGRNRSTICKLPV